MTLNVAIALILRYFTEFVYDVVVKKVHDKFLVRTWNKCI